ncbi:YozE family protein [Lactobacillus agrestimuris]|uniref:YozE family protein n=1 Tax=Lactobacillus agrestimuris TaxID=2941328 RepID=UPI0019897C0F|nr:YozE family protein [Lactobacillus agrestimuris]MBD5430989.1 YozE family protein [Lactobacillus sp.]
MPYRESFYRYLMTQRDPDSTDDVAQFANNAQNDPTFPRQEQDYEKLSEYLELNAGYLPSMTIFDQAYKMYQEKMSY